MLVYGGLLVIVVLAVLGIVLLMRESNPTPVKVERRENAPHAAPTTQRVESTAKAEPASVKTEARTQPLVQTSEEIDQQPTSIVPTLAGFAAKQPSTPMAAVPVNGDVQQMATMATPITPSTFLPALDKKDTQTLPKVEDLSQVQGIQDTTTVAGNVKQKSQPLHIGATDDNRIVLSRGQFGALLAELRALRQHSEEMAERLDIVSETLEQLTPTRIEFPSVSCKQLPTSNTPS
jgi:hypothetical protein